MKRMWIFGAIYFLANIKRVYLTSYDKIKLTDYESHKCKRPCLLSEPMRCEYNFVIEHYHTLSRACYNCPYNITDCFRPHCVPADGFRRPIKVVNRMMPGPGIHVCKGDTVIVNVYNEMYDFEGTAIHWHGIFQKGSPEMDGVALVTQCPISAHSAFQYKFKVDNSGTHFWHAHAGLQRGDGVFGSLVVRDTEVTDVMGLYDYDLPEHTIIVHDWLEEWAGERFAVHHHAMGDNSPRSVLVHGRGTLASFQPKSGPSHMTHMMPGMVDKNGNMTDDNDHVMNDNDTPTDDTVRTPHHIIKVTEGKRYRMRFISNGILNCPLRVSIDQHNMTVIASDGIDLHPVEVTAFNIFSGERYDVVVRADQPAGNYWIRVEGRGDCGVEYKAASQTAILRYHGTDPVPPSASVVADTEQEPRLLLNPDKISSGTKTIAEMTSVDSSSVLDIPDRNVKKFYFAMDFNKVENYRFLNPEFYPLSAMMERHKGAHSKHNYALQMNRISFTLPHAPPLSQYSDLKESVFCNETWTNKNCETEFCECVHRVVVGLGDIVEFVLVGEGKNGFGNHPMHLHGHSFWVVAMEKVNTSITRREVEELDIQGQITRNVINPPRKDTVMVPDGGYTVIRFKADNPGFWLFHCHVDFHFALGMSVIVQVGQPHQMSPVPRGFPRCGTWQYGVPSREPEPCIYATSDSSYTCFHWFSLVIVIQLRLIIR